MKPWNWSSWSRAVALPALLAGSELAWAYLWLAWLCALPVLALDRAAMSWPAAAFVLGFACFLTLVVLRRRVSERRAAITLLGSGVVVVLAITWLEHGRPLLHPSDVIDLPERLAAAPAAAIALLFGAYLWWRGIALGRNRLHFDDANLRFAVGIGALTGALALSGASGTALSRAAVALLVVQFFACALLSLALARLEDVRRDTPGDGAGLGLSREWLGVLGLTVAGILVVAFALAVAVSAEVAQALDAALSRAYDGLIVVLVYGIALPIGVLAALLIYALRALIALLGGNQPQPYQPPQSPEDFQRWLEQSGSAHLPPGLAIAGKWLLLALIVTAVAVVIMRAVFRYRHGREDEVEEIHESIWPGGSLLSALWAWLLALLGGLRRQPRGVVPAEPAPMVVAINPDVQSVRDAYRAWLRAAAGLGRPRAPDQTATEFLPVGRELVPEAASELTRLTEVYEAARYGPPPLTPAAVDAARAAWATIEQRLPQPAERGDGP